MGLAAASAPATKHGRRLREDDGWGTWEHGRGCAACKHGRARRGREGAAKKIGGSAAAGFVEGGGEDEVMEEIWGDREEEDDEPVAVHGCLTAGEASPSRDIMEEISGAALEKTGAKGPGHVEAGQEIKGHRWTVGDSARGRRPWRE